MTVYLVTSGFDSTEVIGIFSTLEKAQSAINARNCSLDDKPEAIELDTFRKWNEAEGRFDSCQVND